MSIKTPVPISLKRYEFLGIFVPGFLVAICVLYMSFAIGSHGYQPFNIISNIFSRWLDAPLDIPHGILPAQTQSANSLMQITAASKPSSSLDSIAQLITGAILFLLLTMLCGNMVEWISKYIVESTTFNHIFGYPYQLLLDVHWFKYRGAICLSLAVPRPKVTPKKTAKRKSNKPKRTSVHLTKASHVMHAMKLLKDQEFERIKYLPHKFSDGAESLAFPELREDENQDRAHLLSTEGPKIITHLIFLKAAVFFGFLWLYSSGVFAISMGLILNRIQLFTPEPLPLSAFIFAGVVIFLIVFFLPISSGSRRITVGFTCLSCAIAGFYSAQWIGATLFVPIVFVAFSIYCAVIFVICAISLMETGMHKRRVALLARSESCAESRGADQRKYSRMLPRLGDVIVSGAWRQEQVANILCRVCGINLKFPADVRRRLIVIIYNLISPGKRGEDMDAGYWSDKGLYKNSEPYWAAYWAMQRRNLRVTDKVNKYVNLTTYHRNMIGALMVVSLLMPITGLFLARDLVFIAIITCGIYVVIPIKWSEFVFFYIFTTKTVLRQLLVENSVSTVIEDG